MKRVQQGNRETTLEKNAGKKCGLRASKNMTDEADQLLRYRYPLSMSEEKFSGEYLYAALMLTDS